MKSAFITIFQKTSERKILLSPKLPYLSLQHQAPGAGLCSLAFIEMVRNGNTLTCYLHR